MVWIKWKCCTFWMNINKIDISSTFGFVFPNPIWIFISNKWIIFKLKAERNIKPWIILRNKILFFNILVHFKLQIHILLAVANVLFNLPLNYVHLLHPSWTNRGKLKQAEEWCVYNTLLPTILSQWLVATCATVSQMVHFLREKRSEFTMMQRGL